MRAELSPVVPIHKTFLDLRATGRRYSTCHHFLIRIRPNCEVLSAKVSRRILAG